MTTVLAPSVGAPQDPRARLAVAGDLDGAGAIRLRAHLDDAIAPGVDLTLDLSDVEHLSAQALAVLVHAYRRLRDGGGSLALDEVSTPVLRVLRISGLHRVLLPSAA